MFNAEFWNEIKEKYPKAYKIIVSFIGLDLEVKTEKLIAISNLICLCYCDLEKFFRVNYNILIFHRLIEKSFSNFEYYILYNENNLIRRIYQTEYDTTLIQQLFDDMIIAAVKKAFEILEKQLSEVK